MADLVHNRWYQSSSVLGGYSTAEFRAPVSHAITGDETHIARFENSELKKGINEVAEKCKKIAETLEEIRLKSKESQDRILDRLAQLQQRLSQRFQISPKMAVEEQPPSIKEEEFTIDVYGGQDLEKKGVQVVELEPDKREKKESKSGKQNPNLKSVANLQNNIEGSRSRGGGDFAGGFIGGGGGLDSFAGESVVRGWSTSVGNHQPQVVHLQWEPGGWFEPPLIKQMEANLQRRERGAVIVTDTGWSRLRGGGDFAGGFTGGGPSVLADAYGVEILVSNQLWLAENCYPEIGGKKGRVTGEGDASGSGGGPGTCAGKFEGNINGKSLKMIEGREGERRSD